MKKAFIISGVFISSLVGAGFASGSEILFYFSRYGAKGLIGIISACILFGILQYLIILHTNKKNCSFDDYLNIIMDKKKAMVISFVAYAFMLMIFSAMLSGFGEMCFEMFGINKLYGVIIMIVCSYFILSGGYSLFVRAESILSLVIVLSIIISAGYILLFRERNVAVFSVTNNFAASSLSYVSYNILTTSAVLCVLGKNSDRKTILLSSVVTAVTLTLIMTAMWYIICLYSGMIELGEIPFLTICMRQSKFIGYFYSISIFISMLTTAVSNGYILRNKLNLYTDAKKSLFTVLITGFVLSSFNFSFIVDKLYRIAGIVSIVLIYYIIKYTIQKNNKN